jgi:hypothetical protein
MLGSSGLAVVTDLSEADWVAASLQEIGDRVALSSVLPPGLGAYARILHPAGAVRSYDTPPEPWPNDVTWSQIAAMTGRRMHPRVQFDSLIGVSRYGGHRDWEAKIGTLSPELWEALTDVLARHTSGAGSAYFALWDGWGWDAGQRGSVVATTEDQPATSYRMNWASKPDAFPPEVMRGPRLSLPGRHYSLFKGPLDAWPSVFFGNAEGEWQSPQLCWPHDRAWCVATEIDFDSTYVGGPPALIAAVLEDPRFESYPAEPTDRVDMGGDELNGLPESL